MGMPGLQTTWPESFEWHLGDIGYVLKGNFSILSCVLKAGVGAF